MPEKNLACIQVLRQSLTQHTYILLYITALELSVAINVPNPDLLEKKLHVSIIKIKKSYWNNLVNSCGFWSNIFRRFNTFYSTHGLWWKVFHLSVNFNANWQYVEITNLPYWELKLLNDHSIMSHNPTFTFCTCNSLLCHFLGLKFKLGFWNGSQIQPFTALKQVIRLLTNE